MYDELKEIFERFLLENNVCFTGSINICDIIDHYIKYPNKYIFIFIQHGTVFSTNCFTTSSIGEDKLDKEYFDGDLNSYWISLDVKKSLRYSYLQNLL
jgi:hypothetical protein